MITLTTEQAQQIEKALAFAASHSEYLADDLILYGEALATIRAARGQEQAEQEPIGMIIGGRLESLVDKYETGAWPIYAAPVQQAEQPVSQEYQDHLVNQSFDWAAMAAKHQFMEGYRIGLAEMREKCATVVTEHAPTCSPHWVSYVVAIRAIKFEGDTGFRPVSEMIAEHKQDPKKAAAIEKAKMRKAEQEPVPTGATHYQPHQKTYYKRVSATEWYLWSCTGKGWLPSKGTSDSSEWIMLSPIQAHQPAKPAEQEPVAIDELARACNLAGIEYKDFLRIKAHLPIAAPVQQAEQEPVAWMWACTECGTEAEDGTDGRICSSCGYHKFYKAPKDTAYVCEARAQEQPHPDDEAVDRFAAAMKAKLEKKRAEGRGGWEDKNQCSAEFLNRLLNEHVGKGDPVDVGNLAMMLWNRGERTEVVREHEHTPYCKQAPMCDKPCGDTSCLHTAATVKQAPVAYLCDGARYKVLGEDRSGYGRILGLPESLAGTWVALVDATDGKHLRAEPARTKDLTDFEIDCIRFNLESGKTWIDFARAVIAKDREKNK